MSQPYTGPQILERQQEANAGMDLAIKAATVENIQGQAAVGRATANVAIPAHAALEQSSIPINTQAAIAQAAQNYKDVQGGGIAAQSYIALPYIIGGAFILGLVVMVAFGKSTSKRR